MAFRTRKLNQKGYTLIEMAIATLLLGIMATTVVLANRFANKQAVLNQDRTFATEKAIQMYEELRALVSGNETTTTGTGPGSLDNYSNHSLYDTVLTTDIHVDTGLASANPADPLSGNFKSDGNWRYIRQIEVNLVPNDTQARQVTVKVYLYPGDYAVNSTNTPGTLLATVGGILRTSAEPNVPTQVMDLYILQINNIPSWWNVLPTLACYMQADILDLKSRLNGTDLRTHFITRTSYGRDYYYQPETNSSAHPAESTHQQWVYYYPGICTQEDLGSGNDLWYYDPQSQDPNSVLMDGNFMVDGVSNPVSTTQFNNDSVASYSVADQWNNAMRYPDEVVAYAGVTAAAAQAVSDGWAVQDGVTEISERMLFENMLSEPASFQNAIIVNLHGELLPLPALRNYSDAAKDPGNQLAACPVTNSVAVTCAIAASNGVTGDQNVRVVTHPELLYYPVSVSGATAVTVRLRVYAYYDTEDMGGSYPSGDPRVPAISVFLPDASATVMAVTAIAGNTTTKYTYVSASGFSTPPTAYTSASLADGAVPMSMSVSYVGPGQHQTLITLFNTPLTCPVTANEGGLNDVDMLYGMEYIPCSPDYTTANQPSTTAYNNNTYAFTSQDLTNTTTNAGTPKNTARWVISLAIPVTQNFPGPVTIGVWNGGLTTATAGVTFSEVGLHAFETRLGNGVTSSTFINSTNVAVTIPPNLSRTYVWCGATTPPYTEQYQFTGDPRDCPYLDVKVGGITIGGAGVTIGPSAYNWWFKNDSTGPSTQMAKDGYSGFNDSQGNSPWNGNVAIDIPRYYQIIRQGLLKTTSIWAGTNGFSWFYYGLGGEVGSDQPERSNGIEMMSDLFMTANSSSAAVSGYNDILGDSGWNSGGLWYPSNIVSTTGNSVTWYARPWLGELYPDKSYLSAWVSYGNLPSIAPNSNIASKAETFFLEGTANIGYPGLETGNGGKSNDGFEGETLLPNPNGDGINSFYDGLNSGGTGKRANHEYDGDSGYLLSLGVTTYNVYPFPLAASVSVNRGWDFAGGNPPESGYSPYNSAGMTTVIDLPSVTNSTTGGVTNRIFYDYNGQGGSTPEYGSGVIRMTQTNAGVTQVGYVVETGTAPSGDVGAQTLAETALVEAMRIFLDGGQMAVTGKAGHIVQLPLVKIFLTAPVPVYNATSTIAFTVASPVTATTNGGGAVSVGMPVTDIWWRFNPNGLASYYTEEYPNYTKPMTTETGMYQESVSVLYNLKYSGNGGKSWFFVQDNSAAVTGVCDTNTVNGHCVTLIAPWTYNWPVANGGTTLAQGDYELMVEAYRQNYGLHYSYDIQDLEVSW